MAKRIIVIISGILGVAILSGLTYLKVALPDVGAAPKISIERTPARIARGKYLAWNVMACMDCHSEKNWDEFAGPVDTTQTGSGGQVFDHNNGIPGTFISTNLTPFHLSDWSDGEIYRAITMGVSKDGRALFPVMPYRSYGQMDTEDIYAVIAYLRTLPVVEANVDKPVADFPMNFIINTIPQKAAPKKAPSPKDTVAYGGYLVMAADCRSCHTADKGTAFAGGRAFKLTGGTTYSANITPDQGTGIGAWNKRQFIARFKNYKDVRDAQIIEVGDFQTTMPWWQFSKMTDADLAAIYTYLKTQKPVENQVVRFQPGH